jgi:hypothetical protein
MTPTAQKALENLYRLPGASVVHPIDTPAGTLRVEEGRIAGRILSLVLTHGHPDVVVVLVKVWAIVD